MLVLITLMFTVVVASAATFLSPGVVGRAGAGYGFGGQTVTDEDVSSVGDINTAVIPRAQAARPVSFPSEKLPFTGSSPLRVTAVAAGLAIVGAVLVRGARRRMR
jgi:hypothetical protein